MKENDSQELENKILFGTEISDLDIAKIKMLCDYIILDKFGEVASFIRFEKCFGPLFSKENPRFLVEVFEEICGEKRKYISFRRMVLSFIKWKSKKSKNNNFNKFMDIIFNQVIKKNNEVVGIISEGDLIFSTRSGRPRKIITRFSVYTDQSKNKINGFSVQYDECYEANLSKQKNKNNITLEINLELNTIDGKITRNNMNNRDGISHIAGKYSIVEKQIKFLIFKCHSGKTFYIGDNTENENEKIELFIFGTSSCQLKTLKIGLNKNGNQIKFIDPKFQPSISFNQNFAIDFEDINENYLNEKQLIFEENDLVKIPIENLNEINNILIPSIKDEAFIDINKLKEEKEGKLFEEVYKSYLISKPEKKELKRKEIMQKADEKRRKSIRSAIDIIQKYELRCKSDVLRETKKNTKMDSLLVKMVKFVVKVKRKKKKLEQMKESTKNEKNDDEIIEEEIEEESEEEDKEEDKKEDKKEDKGKDKEEEKKDIKVSFLDVASQVMSDPKLKEKIRESNEKEKGENEDL